MIIYAGSGKPFVPVPSFFIGCFDTYDREETWGAELNQYDPNDPTDRHRLARIAIAKMMRFENESPQHLWLLARALEDALNDPDYDFAAILKDDEENCFFLPWVWEIKNPRDLFAEILLVAKEEWKESLEQASREATSRG